MRRKTIAAFLLVLGAFPVFAAVTSLEKTPVDYVNPLMGTMSSHELSMGNTYPAITMPWGMNTWTPMTGERGSGWTYTYTADKITGLKLTHQPSPWINDYGQLILMPFSGEAPDSLRSLASWFSHKAETATPYYYSVYLADFDLLAEMAPTERAATLRFIWRHPEKACLLVDALDGDAKVVLDPSRRKITGYSTKNCGGVPENFRMWFVIEFDREWQTSQNETESLKALDFGEISVLNARVAASFISPEQAETNLRELRDMTLEETAATGKDRWNEVLGRIAVDDDDTDKLRTFYSCLYRSLIFPRQFHEYDAAGNPIHYSPYNGEVLPGRLYTDTGFWDTFRALFPLLNMVYPDRALEIQEGLANAWKESGFLPEWASPGHRGCMVGNNSASVAADARLSGVESPYIEELWQAVVHGANSVHPEISSTGRLGFEDYNRLGYVPYDQGINESAARTLEYAYDDWCIYKLGESLGKSQKELEPFAERALNYRNLYDAESGLMRGRNADGSFHTPFNPLKWGDEFTEGNAWHYTWSVFHDPAGLAALMGGADEMEKKLDSVFTVAPDFDESYYGFVIHEIREMQIMDMGNYAHGNQPIQHMIYLYDWTPSPWKAQKRVHEVMERFYSPTPDGYCGDEDNGQTSAWYVFSALGFYPVCPGSGQYVLGSPLFRNVVLTHPDGTVSHITAVGSGPYIKNMTIDGKPWDNFWIPADTIRKGADISFEMTHTPATDRKGDTPPYSFSDEIKK